MANLFILNLTTIILAMMSIFNPAPKPATTLEQPTWTSEPTATATLEPTWTPEPTATATLEPTWTPEPTATATLEPTWTPEPTATATLEPTWTPEPTATATLEPTWTPEPTATATPEPTWTPEPTATPLRTPRSTSYTEFVAANEVTQAAVGEVYSCGDQFTIQFFYQPIMSRAQSGITAKGSFLQMRVVLTNLAQTPIENLSPRSFRLYANYNDALLNFAPQLKAASESNIDWSLNRLSDQVQPRKTLDTYLMFDTIASGTDWMLEFAPMTDGEPLCRIVLGVPPINFQ